jgi:hypothetical protein
VNIDVKRMARLGGLLVLLLCAPVPAAEVAGVTFAEQVTLKDGEVLVLNGAGLRSKFFVKVYAAGLYLETPATEPAAIIDAPGRKRIRMHFLRDVDARRITGAWREGFQANLGGEQLGPLVDRLERFNAFFPDISEGDEIVFELDPERGTEVIIAGDSRGVIPGQDFMRALLRVWLGEQPADASLKEAWLRGAPGS